MKRARILLADSQSLLMEALAKLLDPEFEIVGSVMDGNALIKAGYELQPNIVVLDVELPIVNGLEAGHRLITALPNLKLIYLTMNNEPETAAEAFRIGANAYLLKTLPASEFVQAIQLATKGCSYLTPLVNKNVTCSFSHNSTPRPPAELTVRQREVLRLLAEGRSMKEVAFALQITPRTVAYHKYRMMRDFHLNSTAALVRFAMARQVA